MDVKRSCLCLIQGTVRESDCMYCEKVGLERGPLSLVRITKELLEWKSSGSGLENRDYGRGDRLH
jgi:hypothetical protein